MWALQAATEVLVVEDVRQRNDVSDGRSNRGSDMAVVVMGVFAERDSVRGLKERLAIYLG